MECDICGKETLGIFDYYGMFNNKVICGDCQSIAKDMKRWLHHSYSLGIPPVVVQAILGSSNCLYTNGYFTKENIKGKYKKNWEERKKYMLEIKSRFDDLMKEFEKKI